MGRIYGNSISTIIMAAGENPEYGLPGVSSRTRIEQLSIRVSRHCLVQFRLAGREIRDSKWNTRGWTY